MSELPHPSRNLAGPERQPRPVAQALPVALSPQQAARRLAALPHLMVLESTMRHASLGRYSFVMADPIEWCQPDDPAAALIWLDACRQRYACETMSGLPPFQGGVAGLFSYDFGAQFESLPAPRHADLVAPTVALGLYDVVLAWDHVKDQSWLISHGIKAASDAHEPAAQVAKARQRADEFLRLLANSAAEPGAEQVEPKRLEPARCQPVSAVRDLPGLRSNFSADEYHDAVARALDFIYAGDIFQVNIAQRLLHPAIGHPLDLYAALASCNPAPFAGFLDTGTVQVVSASPERLVSVRNGWIETRPIKGTRPRTRRPEVDLDVGQELRASEKDCAENTMIVDLMRNDLSRICTTDSIRVTQFLGLESYASVLHLVSAIEGKLRDDTNASALLAAVFPGGSVTGAPKIRAMEIIAELEEVPRGPYCGSLGYFSLDGTIDLNILIRTATVVDGWWQIPVGGGIVVGSDPVREYDETWTKAAAMLEAVRRVTAS